MKLLKKQSKGKENETVRQSRTESKAFLAVLKTKASLVRI